MAATETLCRASRVSIKKAPKAPPTGKLRRRDPVAIIQNASRKQAGTDPAVRRDDMPPTLGAWTTRRAEGTEGVPRRRTCATPTKLRRRDDLANLTVPALGAIASDVTRLTTLATTDVEEESIEAEEAIELQEHCVFSLIVDAHSLSTGTTVYNRCLVGSRGRLSVGWGVVIYCSFPGLAIAAARLIINLISIN